MNTTMTVRVKWIHDCPMPDECLYDEGTVWKPLCKSALMTDYECAKALELTADPPPRPGRPHAMVAWDCRSGVLQCHYWDELKVIE